MIAIRTIGASFAYLSHRLHSLVEIYLKAVITILVTSNLVRNSDRCNRFAMNRMSFLSFRLGSRAAVSIAFSQSLPTLTAAKEIYDHENPVLDTTRRGETYTDY